MFREPSPDAAFDAGPDPRLHDEPPRRTKASCGTGISREPSPRANGSRNNHPPASPVVFHFLSPAARAAIGGTGREPSYYRLRACRARDDPEVTQSFLAPRKRAVCLPLPRLPSARGGSLPQARRKRFYQRPRFTTLPPRCARRPLYKVGRSDAITRFQVRTVHRQSRACTRNLSAEFRYQKAALRRVR